MNELMIIIIIILSLSSIWLFKKAKYLSKYSIFLEDEYFNFINLLAATNNEEKSEIIIKAKKTTLYKKIRYDRADNTEKLRIMHEDNEFYKIVSDNDRPIGF